MVDLNIYKIKQHKDRYRVAYGIIGCML
jgi:hypothetical protein